jgi:catechol 2,3-dioxygenase-like lactoylglutathione lyase family enzyme
MKPKLSILTLAVDDLERSLTFYRDGLGLPTSGIAGPEHGGHHILFELEDGLSLVLFLRSALADVIGQPATGRNPLAGVLSHYAASNDEVDSILARAEAAGAILSPAVDQPWGAYTGYFADPDGHIWEIMARR